MENKSDVLCSPRPSLKFYPSSFNDDANMQTAIVIFYLVLHARKMDAKV